MVASDVTIEVTDPPWQDLNRLVVFSGGLVPLKYLTSLAAPSANCS